MKTAVYVGEDRTGHVIYIGITWAWRYRIRWAEHQETKPWARHVMRWRVIEICKNRTEAKALETILIEEFDPPANVAEAKTGHVDWTRITKRRWWHG